MATLNMILPSLLLLIFGGCSRPFVNDSSKLFFFSKDCIPCCIWLQKSLFLYLKRLASDLRDFLKCLELKRRILSHSLQTGSKLGHFSNAKAGPLHLPWLSPPACTNPKDQPKVEAYGPFRSFLSVCLSLGMHIVLQIPWYI